MAPVRGFTTCAKTEFAAIASSKLTSGTIVNIAPAASVIRVIC